MEENYSLEAALSEVESQVTDQAAAERFEEYRIFVKNAASGNKIELSVFSDNQLKQAAEAAAFQIGLTVGKPFIYTNSQGKSTTTGTMTMLEFGIGEDCVLTVSEYGTVAAKIPCRVEAA